MYVCICAALTEKEIVSYIKDGAKTLEDLAESCDAGSGCGSCVEELKELLQEHSE